MAARTFEAPTKPLDAIDVNGSGFCENVKYHGLNHGAPEPTPCKSGSEHATMRGHIAIPGALAFVAVLIVVRVGIAVNDVNERWKAWTST